MTKLSQLICLAKSACSVVSDSATVWTVACQALLSLEFSRQEYWSGLPFPTPGDVPDPEMELIFFTTVPHGKYIHIYVCVLCTKSL